MNFDYMSMIIILLVFHKKAAAIESIFLKYMCIFGIIQPLIFLIQKEPQYTHSFLAVKSGLLFIICLTVVCLYEGYLIKITPFLGFLYLLIPCCFLALEIYNPQIMKLVYTLIGLHNEDDLFNFPENLLEVNQVAFEEYFFNYINHPKIKDYSKYIKAKFEAGGGEKKNPLVWRIMKAVIQLQREEDSNFLRNKRRQKVESHYRVLVRNKHMTIDLIRKPERKVQSYRTYKNAGEKMESIKGISMSEKRFENAKSVFYDKMKSGELESVGSSEEHEEAEGVGSLIEIRDNEEMGFFVKRLQRIRLPKNKLNRVMYLLFFPWHLMFSLLIPNIKMTVRLKDMFFGTITCLILLALLAFGIFSVSNTYQHYFGLNSFGFGGINCGMLLGFFLYCLKFENHKELMFFISMEEVAAVEISVYFLAGSFLDMISSNQIPISDLN